MNVPSKGSRWKRSKDRQSWGVVSVDKYAWGVSVCVSQGSGPFKKWVSASLTDFHKQFKPVAKTKPSKT